MNTPLETYIEKQMRHRGAVSFAQFMHWALYHPKLGYYYRSPTVIGRSGDFFTSVAVGPLFGELLARQFSQWFSQLNSPVLHCLEAGAHQGQLACDILTAWRNQFPQDFAKILYCILEPSAQAQAWQREKLAEFAPQVRWFDRWQEIAPHSISGVIFCNELLDAFPLHRMGWDSTQRSWFEWGVDWNGHCFHWTRLSKPTIQERPGLLGPVRASPRSLPAALANILPNEFTTEICPAAEAWWRDAAQRLRRGYLLTLDYGLEELEFFAPHRAQGTLQAFYRHHPTSNPLNSPGQQDLTAQINFTAIQREGEQAGLVTKWFGSQSNFLIKAYGESCESDQTIPGRPTIHHALQFNTLTHPDHLGHSHRVLVQEPAKA